MLNFLLFNAKCCGIECCGIIERFIECCGIIRGFSEFFRDILILEEVKKGVRVMRIRLQHMEP